MATARATLKCLVLVGAFFGSGCVVATADEPNPPPPITYVRQVGLRVVLLPLEPVHVVHMVIDIPSIYSLASEPIVNLPPIGEEKDIRTVRVVPRQDGSTNITVRAIYTSGIALPKYLIVLPLRMPDSEAIPLDVRVRTMAVYRDDGKHAKPFDFTLTYQSSFDDQFEPLP